MNFEEVNKLQGLPWQPEPNAAGVDVQPRVILLMEVRVTDGGEVNTRPSIARGVAVKKSEYMAMGPTQDAMGARRCYEEIVIINLTVRSAVNEYRNGLKYRRTPASRRV